MLALVAVLLTTISSASGFDLRGQATTLDGKQVLYSEVHNVTVDEEGLNKKVQTEYFKADGTLLGRMTSEFGKSKTVPSIQFEDLRFKIKESLRWEGDGDRVCLRSEKEGEGPKEKCFKANPKMVAGQGFDNFVKINFQKLIDDTVPLSFGVVTERDFFSFKGHVKSKPGEVPVRFGIRLSNMFLRMFLDELVVEYDPITKHLLSYRGLSNLKSDEGKAQKVWIKYEVRKP